MALRIQLEIVDGTVSDLCPGLKETKTGLLFSLFDIDLSRYNRKARTGHRSLSSVMPSLK